MQNQQLSGHTPVVTLQTQENAASGQCAGSRMSQDMAATKLQEALGLKNDGSGEGWWLTRNMLAIT